MNGGKNPRGAENGNGRLPTDASLDGDAGQLGEILPEVGGVFGGQELVAVFGFVEDGGETGDPGNI